MEKQVKTYIKALKKSINQERFLIRVAGLEYEVAQKLPQTAPIHENCGPGWERESGRCGKTGELGWRCFTVLSCSTRDVKYTLNVHLCSLDAVQSKCL